jgi:hypothetical protein
MKVKIFSQIVTKTSRDAHIEKMESEINRWIRLKNPIIDKFHQILCDGMLITTIFYWENSK